MVLHAWASHSLSSLSQNNPSIYFSFANWKSFISLKPNFWFIYIWTHVAKTFKTRPVLDTLKLVQKTMKHISQKLHIFQLHNFEITYSLLWNKLVSYLIILKYSFTYFYENRFVSYFSSEICLFTYEMWNGKI